MRTTWSWQDGGQAFAIDRRVVIAMLDAPDLAPVPFAPSWLVGVVNRFGRAVAVVDCGHLGGLVERLSPVRQVLIVRAAGAELGLALCESAVERAVSRVGDPAGFFDVLDDAAGTRVVVVERLAHSIAEWLGGVPGA
jgi:hypothetical protein